jgi:hypothetical protein
MAANSNHLPALKIVPDGIYPDSNELKGYINLPEPAQAICPPSLHVVLLAGLTLSALPAGPPLHLGALGEQ